MHKNAKTIGVISIKGGVGKTTIVSNLGIVLARDLGKKVLVVDANFSTPHCGLHVGLINPEKTLHHVLREEALIEEALYEHETGLHIIPGSLAPVKISPLKLKNKISPLKKNYDYILLDSSPSLNDEILATIQASDELLVISSLDYPTLSATLHAIKVAKKNNTPIKGIVINKALRKKFEIPYEEIEKAAGVPVLAVLSEDKKVLEALATTTPITLFAPNRPLTREYQKLAANLIGETYIDKGLLYQLNSWIENIFIKNKT